MIERSLSVESAGLRLAGTLCLPDDAVQKPGGQPRAMPTVPTVLMVHGSGPLDRNENVRGQTLNAFNAIAHYLATRGIASLRYDKRGCGESEGDFNATGHHELVDDAARWVARLAQQPECDAGSVFVLGHSEGSVIAPQVYFRHPEIAGLVLLCPFITNLEQILQRQARQIEHELASRPGLGGVLPNMLGRWLGADARAQERMIRRIRKSTSDTLRVRLHRIPARWYREMFALDLAAIYQRVHCPVLILGGAKDLQCDPRDVAAIEALIPGEVTAEVVPDLTHLLRLEPGEPSLVRARRLLAAPLEPVVIEAVALWLQEQVAANR